MTLKFRSGREFSYCSTNESQHAVETLSHDFRQAVIMADRRHVHKEKYGSYALPLRTVMSRLYRGRKLLRESLYDYAKDLRLVGKNKRKKRS